MQAAHERFVRSWLQQTPGVLCGLAAAGIACAAVASAEERLNPGTASAVSRSRFYQILCCHLDQHVMSLSCCCVDITSTYTGTHQQLPHVVPLIPLASVPPAICTVHMRAAMPFNDNTGDHMMPDHQHANHCFKCCRGPARSRA